MSRFNSREFLVALVAIGFCLLASFLFGQAVVKNVDQVFNPATAADPCQNPGVAKSSVAVTATGQVIALSTGTKVYACTFAGTFGGTNPTVKFQYGTGTNCGTGTTDLTGSFAPAPNGTVLELGYGGTLFSTAASNALCISLGGTSPTVAGVLTYVQQ